MKPGVFTVSFGALVAWTAIVMLNSLSPWLAVVPLMTFAGIGLFILIKEAK